MRSKLRHLLKGEYVRKGMCFTGGEEAAAASTAAKGAGEAAGAGALEGALPFGESAVLAAEPAAAAAGALPFGESAVLAAEPAAAGAAIPGALPAGEAGFLAAEPAAGATGAVPGATTAAPGPTGGAATPSTPAAPVQVAAPTPTAAGLPVGGGAEAAEFGPPVADGSVPDPLRTAVDTATGTAAATPPPATSGISKALQSLGITGKDGGIGPNVLPLGVLAASQANAARAGKSTQAQLEKVASPAQEASKRLLAEGAEGTVPPAVMQQFERSLKDKTAEIVQRYANMGRDAATDSAAQSEIAKARDAMDAQVAQYAASLTTQGLQAAGVAAGPATQAVMAGAQKDQELQKAMAGSLQQMALLQALSRGQQPGAAP